MDSTGQVFKGSLVGLFQGNTIACFLSCACVRCKLIPIIQYIVLIIFVLIIKQEYVFIGSPLFLCNHTSYYSLKNMYVYIEAQCVLYHDTNCLFYSCML